MEILKWLQRLEWSWMIWMPWMPGTNLLVWSYFWITVKSGFNTVRLPLGKTGICSELTIGPLNLHYFNPQAKKTEQSPQGWSLWTFTVCTKLQVVEWSPVFTLQEVEWSPACTLWEVNRSPIYTLQEVVWSSACRIWRHLWSVPCCSVLKI